MPHKLAECPQDLRPIELLTLYSPRPPPLFLPSPFPGPPPSRGKHRLALSPHIADAAVTCALAHDNASKHCPKHFFQRREKGQKQYKRRFS